MFLDLVVYLKKSVLNVFPRRTVCLEGNDCDGAAYYRKHIVTIATRVREIIGQPAEELSMVH